MVLDGKDFTMKKFFIAVVAATLGLSFVDVSDAQIFGRRRERATYYAPAQNVVVPQGQAGTGYRTYSYQPAMTPTYQPMYQSSRRTTNLPPHLRGGHNSAGFKQTDF
jgi:hypothetical protein